jgi:hypothetical protein
MPAVRRLKTRAVIEDPDAGGVGVEGAGEGPGAGIGQQRGGQYRLVTLSDGVCGEDGPRGSPVRSLLSAYAGPARSSESTHGPRSEASSASMADGIGSCWVVMMVGSTAPAARWVAGRAGRGWPSL